MQKLLPIVAIVGQPNVGKSTLLNKIAGQRLAVTSDVAGTTRDRQYFDASWNGVSFTLVDTAGLMTEADEELQKNVAKQIEIAINEAAIIILVVDGLKPPTNLPQTLLRQFRKSRKPVLLAVNKVDSPKQADTKSYEFQILGIKPILTVSAVTGRGIGNLLDVVAESLKKHYPIKPTDAPDDTSIKVAIVGKPNVGKSSIFNALLKEERAVVSSVPGTTRTAIDSRLEIQKTVYTFIDTAGLKKKEHRQAQADIYSGFQTFKSIRRSDVCLLVLDATQAVTKQDLRIAQEIVSMHKGCVILANKIDLYKGEQQKLQDYISFHFPFLWMCPVFFVSGLTGEGLQEAISAIPAIFNTRNKKIDNQTLSEFLSRKLKTNPPKLLRDQKQPKVFSLHQTNINPPTFELLVNHPAAISVQFRRFLENSIIKDLDFWGTPIILKLTGKDKK